MWWATKTYSLLANTGWYVVYLWVLPPYILWPFARKRLKHAAG